MLVIVKMKDKTMYKGIKCGSEGGLVYLVNPMLLTEDEEDMTEGYLETAVGDEVEDLRILQLPLTDIKTIESAR